jgi:hypothetical protein
LVALAVWWVSAGAVMEEKINRLLERILPGGGNFVKRLLK